MSSRSFPFLQFLIRLRLTYDWINIVKKYKPIFIKNGVCDYDVQMKQHIKNNLSIIHLHFTVLPIL
ncbi:hypothetical protein PGB90_003408 [Kerria lacca]